MTVNPTNIPPTPIDLGAIFNSLAARWPQSDRIDKFSAKLAERPAQNTLIILGVSAVVFYGAERDVNPKVNTIFDAMEYCSSSLSVGYTGIFPQTAIGKMVATLLMTYGPALANAIIQGPKASQEPLQITVEKVVLRLEEILAELRNRPSA